MANVKISALPVATTMADTDVVAGVVGGVTEQVSRALVLTAESGQSINLQGNGGYVTVGSAGAVIVFSTSSTLSVSNSVGTATLDFSGMTAGRTYTFPDSSITLGSGGGGGTLSVSTKTANYSMTSSDDVILGDASLGAFNVTLPDATTATSKRYVMKKVDATGFAVSILPVFGQQIDGAGSFDLSSQYATCSLITDGANWFADVSSLTP